MDTEYSTITEKLGDATSILLLAPALSDHEDVLCTDLLQRDDQSAENMLWVSYTKSPDAQLRRWRANADGPPDNLGIISVGDSSRSAASARGGGGSSMRSSGLVETVSNPNDLTGLGIRISEYLHRWTVNEGDTAVCFDSLTAMLQYVELETAYEFLHIVTGRFYAVGGVAHFHMDPGAHDERTIEVIASLCDAVVELDADGSASIRTR